MIVQTHRLGRREGSSRTYQLLTACALALLLVGTIVGILVPAGSGWDFANFYDTGRRVAAGQLADIYDPHSLIGGEPPQGKLGFYGSPISALAYAPLSYFSPNAALIVFKVQNTLAYFLALGFLFLHNRRFAESTPAGQWRFAALFAGLALAFQPFWTIYRVGGQTTPTFFLLLVLALFFHERSRFLPAAACIVLAVLIKPAYVFAPALLVCISGWPFFRRAALVSAVVGLVSVWGLGWGIHQQFLTLLVRGSQESYPWFFNSSIYVFADNLKVLGGVPDSLVLKVAVGGLKLFVLSLFLYVVFQSRKARLPEPAKRHFDFLIAIVLCLLISQTVWEHYLTTLFPLLIYMVACHRHLSRRTLALAAAIFVTAAWQNLIVINFLRAHLALVSPAALVSVGLLKSAPLLLTLLLLVRHHQDLFKTYTDPAWGRSG